MNGPTPSAPDLRIRTTDQGRALTLSGPRLGTDPVTLGTAGEVAIRTLHSQFVQNLVRFRQLVGDALPCTPELAVAALAELAEAGRVFLSQVLESVSDLDRLVECFRRACPTWQGGPRRRPLQIQSYGRLNEHLPWELLPVFEHRHIPSAATVADLDAACRPFGGFAALVERRLPKRVPLRTILDTSRGLGVRFFYHARYDGAQAELGFLRAHAGPIRLRGPYPDGSCPTPSIGQQLRDPTLDDGGRPTDLADHVVHFACHCDTLSPRPDEYAFHLADEDGNSTRVSVRQLLNELVLAAPWADDDAQMPVVFVNACDSAALDSQCGTGLLTPFDKNRNLALIGTVASVPDQLAAGFSQRVYAHLLGGGTLGAALFEARRFLLLRHANPLGILYCLYGNADLRMLPVTRPRPTPTGGHP
ncbi:MAG TPA: CHAT domain-containing protein [Micromonosporaceae bacterium]|nr:CHAT domain-containing protein [Micromonosporaceae bacterium]